MVGAPQPRSRLYTTLSGYLLGLRSSLIGESLLDATRVEKLQAELENKAPGYHAIAVPMARVGIYLALKALIKPGQKVVLSPYTISEVVNMVLCAGGVPRFVDIEGDGSFNISASRVIEVLRSEQGVGAVLVTHYYGLICEIHPIIEECKSLGIPVIEDSAQAFNASIDGKVAGGLADVGVYSFGMLKTVTCFFGGALLVKNLAVAESIRNAVRGWPLLSRKMLFKKILSAASLDMATMPGLFDLFVYWIFRYAHLNDIKFLNNKLDTDSRPTAFREIPPHYMARLSDTQAQILLRQLQGDQEKIVKRIENARIYNEGLRELKNIILPPFRDDGSHVYLNYVVQLGDRRKFSDFMVKNFRDIQISHHRNCASLSCFKEYFSDCPNAERAAERAVYLPVYPSYSEDQILRNVEVIRRFCCGEA